MSLSPWPNWTARSNGQFHKGQPLYLPTYLPTYRHTGLGLGLGLSLFTLISMRHKCRKLQRYAGLTGKFSLHIFQNIPAKNQFYSCQYSEQSESSFFSSFLVLLGIVIMLSIYSKWVTQFIHKR